MKILHIITGLNTGGAEAMLQKLIAESQHQQETHIVVSMMNEGTHGNFIKKHAKLYCLGLKPGKITFLAIWKLYKLVKMEEPDIIQSWMYHANILAFFVNIFTRKKLYWNIRCSLEQIKTEKATTKFLIKLSALISPFVNKIIFNSHSSIAQHNAIGFTNKNNAFIGNGFDLKKFQYIDKSQSVTLKDSLGIPEKSIVIGHVARYHPVKNHIGFIRTISSLFDLKENLFCVMVGTDVDSENLELVSAINKTGNQNRFILMGEQSDLPSLYGTFDYMVSSSLSEAFPNTIGEAMACGTPCIVTDVGDSKLIVADYGLSYSPNHSEHLLDCLDTAFTYSDDQYLTLSHNCRSYISEFYSIENIYLQYINLYQENI
jgi:glycosyltransferase involved in cell wall biosynthesis